MCAACAWERHWLNRSRLLPGNLGAQLETLADKQLNSFSLIRHEMNMALPIITVPVLLKLRLTAAMPLNHTRTTNSAINASTASTANQALYIFR